MEERGGKAAARRAIAAEKIFYVFLVLMALALLALTLLVFRGEREKNRLLVHYQAEHALMAVGAALQNGQSLPDALPSGVIGYGAYDAEGKPLRVWGTAPARMDPQVGPAWDTRFALHRRERTVSLALQIGRFPRSRGRAPATLPPPRPEGARPQVREPAPRFLYLEMDTSAYWGRERLLAIGRTLLPLLIAALLVYVGLLYRRGARYKSRLETQRQLVHLGEAARTLSHEIRNPLGAIRLRADILARFVSPEGAQDLKTIQQEVDRLRRLTDRVGDFLKNPAGSLEAVDLDPFVREALSLSGERVRYGNRCPGRPVVSFDRERLRSVIENLVRNGLESDTSGGPVEVQLAPAKGGVTLSVLDRGGGVERKDRERVFDPFFTTKLNGSGIGLAITRRFVEAAGGSIGLFPREGGGTEARVTLRKAKA